MAARAFASACAGSLPTGPPPTGEDAGGRVACLRRQTLPGRPSTCLSLFVSVKKRKKEMASTRPSAAPTPSAGQYNLLVIAHFWQKKQHNPAPPPDIMAPWSQAEMSCEARNYPNAITPVLKRPNINLCEIQIGGTPGRGQDQKTRRRRRRLLLFWGFFIYFFFFHK